nr:sodium/proline symporter PutP [uncultured Methanoregula sp.]
MNSYSIETGAAFVLYLAAMMGIGLFYWQKTKTVSEYILGNRELGRFVAALSAEASDMSGWLLIGLPGLAYLCGLQAGWVALGLVAGTFLNWKFIAPRLRIYSRIAGDALTLPEFFRNRFHDRSDLIGIVCAVFILIFFVIYTSAQFVAGGRLFETVFGFDYHTALLAGSLIVIAYTFAGGFRAVCVTDTIQGILMFFAILIVPVTGMILLGGPGMTITGILQENADLLNPFLGPDGNPLPLIAIVSLLAWGLGYFGQPHILVRFMAIKKPEEIRDARGIAMVWVILSLGAAVAIGLIGRVLIYPPLSGAATETVFMVLTVQTFSAFLAGIILCGILAAIMSTASSILLVTGSALSRDVYFPLIRPQAADRELLWVSRLSVLLIAGLALMLGLDPDSFVFSLVAYAWAGFGAAFGPALLAALFWKRTTREGVLAGILVGGITVLVWKQLSLFGMYEIIPGFLLSVIAIIVVSLRTPVPDASVLEEFEKARDETARL